MKVEDGGEKEKNGGGGGNVREKITILKTKVTHFLYL